MRTYIIATPTQRAIALAIDLVIYSFLKFTLAGIFSLVGLVTLGDLIALLYLLFRDSLPFFNYQSIGKKVVKIRAFKEGNVKLDLITDAKRNFIFFPNLLNAFGLYFLYAGGAFTLILILIEIYMLFEKQSTRRMGDKWADTTVIQEEL